MLENDCLYVSRLLFFGVGYGEGDLLRPVSGTDVVVSFLVIGHLEVVQTAGHYSSYWTTGVGTFVSYVAFNEVVDGSGIKRV